VLDKPEELGIHRAIEKRGEGINKLVYWVTDNLLEDWVQLPDAISEQVTVARQIKHIFTGNLNAFIDSNPTFPGKERHFLRAQIARISHATTIIPRGLYEVDEETN
jgi:radial spoke head protein 4A